MATWLVYGLWLALTLSNLVLIARFASPMPVADDWGMFRERTSFEEFDLSFVIARAGRSFFKPIPQAIFALCLRAPGGDLRLGLILMFLPLSIACLYVLRLVGRSSGGHSLTDVVFPLSMLSLGNAPTAMWFTAAFIGPLSALVTAVAARLMLAGPLRHPARTAIVLIGLASLHGIMGLTLCFPLILAAWLQVWWGADGMERRRRWRIAGGLLLLWTTATVFGMVYVMLGEREEQAPVGVTQFLRASVQFLTMSVGQVAMYIWPLSGLAMSALLAGSVWVWLRMWPTARQSRLEWMTDALCLLPVFCLAPLFGLGRATLGGLVDRYAAYSLPLFVSMALLAVKSRRAWSGGPAWASLLTAVPLSAFWFDAQIGVLHALDTRKTALAIQREISAGATPEILFARRHTANRRLDRFLTATRMLHEAQVPPWRDLSIVTYHEVPVDPLTAIPLGIVRTGAFWTIPKSADGHSLVFEFPEQQVDLVRLIMVPRIRRPTTNLTLRWTPHDTPDWNQRESRCHIAYNPARALPESLPALIEVGDRVSRLVFVFEDDQDDFELEELTLLFSEPAPGPAD